MTPKLIIFFTTNHNRVISSQVVEDGVNRQRRVETARFNNRGRAECAWQALVENKVASSVHKYQDVNVQPCDIGSQDRDVVLDRDIFQMDISKQSLDFQDIVSTSSTAPYATTTSYEYGTLFAD